MRAMTSTRTTANGASDTMAVEQPPLSSGWMQRRVGNARRSGPPLCGGCREKEARYGFREADDESGIERPQTLCFECFRVEIGRRQAVAARLARGWNGQQVRLPLDDTLRALAKRRGRAQIAARRALGL
jgi:hypothetical protein